MSTGYPLLAATAPPVLTPSLSLFGQDVLAGLSRTPKQLSCKYLYDHRGSQLFDMICELPEYYPARTEMAIMREFADSIVDHVGNHLTLIELGSGSSTKTRLLLDRLASSSVYVPVDISPEHLLRTAAALKRAYQHMDVVPVCADFSSEFELPLPAEAPRQRVIYFPGSTVGNFTGNEVRQLLRRIAMACGSGGQLLIGLDLDKDPATIEAAYNDRAGVTAEFNLNLLLRINRELRGTFDLDAFAHEAVYDCGKRRIEMRLVSKWRQEASACRRTFQFAPGERIITEYSHKFTVAGFGELARAAGFAPERHWLDERQYFCVMCLVCER